jgi:hypothetical protein
MMAVGAHGSGEITFRALRGSLELEYARSKVLFTRAGFEEMDEVGGLGSPELEDDASLDVLCRSGPRPILSLKSAR